MVGSCNWSIFVVSVGLQVVKCKMADLSHLFKKLFVVKICSSLKWCCNIDHEIDILCSFLEACECFSEHLAILGVQSEPLVSIGLFLLELLFLSSRCWVQETQPELDTFPRHIKMLRYAFLCFPGFNFQSTWSHRHCFYPMLWVVTVAWLYIKPFRDVSSKEPTGDPVDSDPDVFTAEAALSEPTVWSHKDFAIRMKLWPFSPILPVHKIYWTNFFCDKTTLVRVFKYILFRCGPSSTYHLVPLALLQYDAKPTRQYDSIMLIHDSLDTGVFGQMLHPSTIHFV